MEACLTKDKHINDKLYQKNICINLDHAKGYSRISANFTWGPKMTVMVVQGAKTIFLTHLKMLGTKRIMLKSFMNGGGVSICSLDECAILEIDAENDTS
eukprot:10865363-Ditylum_brightwellii.AAC.1